MPAHQDMMPGRGVGSSERVGAVVAALVFVAAVAGCTTRTPPDVSGAGGIDGSGSSSASAPASRQPGDRSGTPTPGAAEPPAAVPAKLAAASAGAAGPSDQCLAEIEAFAELHSGNRVMLGKAAFADSDRLVLTRMPRRGNDGRALDGRAATPQPVVLNLVAAPDGCSVRLGDGDVDPSTPAAGTMDSRGATGNASRASLPSCKCAPLAR